MDLLSIIENYEYAAILIGTFLEGETILVLAGLAAHQGYLVLTWVILAAFLGSLGGDQLFLSGTQTQSGGAVQAPWLEAESGKSSQDDEPI
jgi:membrane protein DedA with SNARE-associated domain